MSHSDDERIAYLTGDAVGSLSAMDRAELDELRELLGAAATWQEADPGLEARVVAAIVAEASAAGPASARADGAAARARARPEGSWWQRLGLRRRAFAFGSAAALAVAAIIAVVVISTGGGSQAPLRFAMVVSGTPLDPAAHGSAALTKTPSGWRIELRATGLPPLSNGRYYEAWLKNAAGILVPVGTFNDARNVTLWSGAPVTKFPAFSVTRQRVGGRQVSSGLRVLTGLARRVR